MENIPILNIALDDEFLSVFSDFSTVVYGVLSLIFFAVLLFTLPVVYKKIRRKFPVKVNCWFCNKNTTVPYELSNRWDCPHCQQYNGFSKSGDYNKIIHEQYNFKLNEGNFNALRTTFPSKEGSPQSNGFCKLCNINQQLKIQQLALFVPMNEDNYFKEIEQYREKLEKAYKLCSKCERILYETLEKQEYNLLQNRLNNHKQNISSPQKLGKFTKLTGENILILLRNYGAVGMKMVPIIITILLFLALVIQYETESQVLNLTTAHFPILEPLLPTLEIFMHCKDIIFHLKKELSFCGLVCCFLAQSENYVKRNHIILLAWGLLHTSLWTSFILIQVLLCGICLILTAQTFQTKVIKLNKKPLTPKSGFQPVKKVFSEFSDTLREETKPMNFMSAPLLRSNSLTSLNEDLVLGENAKVKKVKQPKHNLVNLSEGEDKKKKSKFREEEIESVSNDEKEKPEPVVFNSQLNNSFTNKSFGGSTETEKNNGPFNEVFNTLNGLQLGGSQKKSNKPPNFLFANHNFSEVKSPSSSIIKPAKFIRNLNSSSWTESNDCNSRSSTPSSGYSSQKAEKLENTRYDFPKTMTPISVNSYNRHSPNNCFDYYDGNHGFYNPVNCFPSGFMPFQQFPGSLGHTTIYTCTRPTNFPFPFASWQGFPAQKFSPTSARFSDASDCDNLFQESSKKFEQDRKWLKLKSVFYYFSIFLNFITIMGLVYFISKGMISVDRILPDFHFFV